MTSKNGSGPNIFSFTLYFMRSLTLTNEELELMRREEEEEQQQGKLLTLIILGLNTP